MSMKPTLPEEDDYILEPEPEDEEQEVAPKSKKRGKEAYRPLNNFARVTPQWLKSTPLMPSPYNATGRLFTYLIILSKEGRYSVPLTDELGLEIGLEPRIKRRAAAWLIKTGWARVVGHKGQVPLLMPRVITDVD